MQDNSSKNSSLNHKEKRHGCLRFLFTAFISALIMAAVVGGWVKYNIYASEFRLTELRHEDRQVLEGKLAVLRYSSGADPVDEKKYGEKLEPEAYSEEGARREINLTEKELNALIANNPDMAKRVAIDLSEDLLSLKLVVPMDEDIAVLGGKTLRLKVGVVLAYENDQLVVALKGVSLGGIPVPNAWLGYMKNKNLVEEFGDEGGFWSLFSEGVKDVRVREGHVQIRLKE